MALIAPLIVDKSAWVRAAEPQYVAGWEQLDAADRLRMCDVTALEVLVSARSASDARELERDLDAFPRARMDATTFTAARATLRELAALGAHRLPIPDVLIAACAQQHGLGVLHLDRHFDLLSEHLGFPAVSLRDLI
jgi:predicted nucleic acid-binding protein